MRAPNCLLGVEILFKEAICLCLINQILNLIMKIFGGFLLGSTLGCGPTNCKSSLKYTFILYSRNLIYIQKFLSRCDCWWSEYQNRKSWGSIWPLSNSGCYSRLDWCQFSWRNNRRIWIKWCLGSNNWWTRWNQRNGLW